MRVRLAEPCPEKRLVTAPIPVRLYLKDPSGHFEYMTGRGLGRKTEADGRRTTLCR